MKRCFKLRQVCFSWHLFRLFPWTRPLGEQDDYFAGYAFEWLGLECAFEELQEDGFRFRTKLEMQAKNP